MNKKILSALLLISISAFLGNAISAAAEDKNSDTKTKISLKNFPKNAPEAYYKRFEKIYNFASAGTLEIRTKSSLRVETLFAVNSLCGETFVVYNPRFQKIKINEAFTKMKDGTIVPLPENALNESLPYFAENAPDFNFLKELVITHTALEPGCEIFLDFSVFYEETDGILFDEFAELPFPCELLIFNFNGAITEKHNVPARSREEFFDAKKSVPVIFPGMKFVEKNVFENFKKDELPAAGTKILEEIAPENLGKFEKIAAIQKFVQEEIATVKIAPELLNFELRTPETVLQSGYGVPAEKTRLLALLLKSAVSEENFEPKFDSENEEFFVLGNDKNGNLKRLEIEKQSGFANGICVFSEIEISPEKQIFRGKISQKNSSPNLVPESSAEPKKYFAEILGVPEKNFTQAIAVPEENCGNELVFEFSREEKFENSFVAWRVPVSKNAREKSGWKALPKQRKSDFTISKFRENDEIFESYEFKISLKDGVEFAGKPLQNSLRNEVGETQFSIEKSGDEILVKKSLKISLSGTRISGKIVPEEYAKFRDLMRFWFAPENNRVLFKIEKISPENSEKISEENAAGTTKN